MLELLQYGFMQRAFIAGILIALLCAVIGVFLVLRRMSLLGDGLAHISFGGIAAGMFFGVYPLLSALAFSVLAAIGIQKLKSMKVYGDAAIAIFFSFGLSMGVVLVSLSHGFKADLFSYLFGSILAVSGTDILLILAVGIATLVALLLFYKELFYMTFDEDSARASGIPVERLNAMLVVLTAITVVLSMRIVGILLVSSFLVIPASIALLICRSFRNTIGVAALIGVASVITGLTLAYYFDLATGGAIVLTLVGGFAVVLLYKKLSPRLTPRT
ncbi:MAG: metal ABC transporter permease [Candidatus Micrarchaeota archaeon]|nr:metal ABC transporter permease [Candidatus Micrarchaeota archaeon]